MSEASASARELLGTHHPLVRTDEATTAVERQTLVCATFLLATVAAANNAFESVQRAGKQAAEVADANFQALSTSANRAPRSRKAA